MNNNESPTRVDQARSRPSKVTKSRTRTYTGCWTCRARHLKCDLRKPGCFNCAKSRLTCEGYGVRLSWNVVARPDHFVTVGYRTQTTSVNATTGQEQSPEAEGASAPFPESNAYETVGLEKPTESHDLEDQVQTLNRNTAYSEAPVDNGDDDDITLMRPWDVFPPIIPLRAQLEASATNADPDTGLAREIDQVFGLGQSSVAAGSQQAQSAASDIILEGSLPLYDNSELAGHARIQNRSHLSIEQVQSAQIGISLDPLPQRSGHEALLIEHWVLRLSDILVPIPIPAFPNSLNSIILPLACNGGRDSSNTGGSASLALLHLVLSTSASHLSSSTQGPTSDEWARIALVHHNIALLNLRNNILFSDPQQHLPLLGALLMCIIKEAVMIDVPTWHLHIQGACHWVRNVDLGIWAETGSGLFLYQTFTAVVALAKTQLIPEQENDRIMADALLSFANPAATGYLLDRSLGIPEKTMHVINCMNEIRFGKSSLSSSPYVSTPASASSTSPPDLGKFEMELFLSIPQFDGSSISKVDNVDTLKYHHGYLYHYATLIYFKRIIRKCPPEEVQSLVTRCLEHLEAIIKYTSRPFSPGIWPVAMVLFEMTETDARKRAMNWLDAMYSRTCLNVFTKLKGMATALWAAVEGQQESEVEWQTFIREKNGSSMILF